jgi:hypothetical protein
VYAGEKQVAQPPTAPDAEWPDSDNIVLKSPITQAEADGIRAGTLRISFYGFIRYADEFTLWPLFHEKTTGFCFTYSLIKTQGSPFATCPEPAYTYQK